MCSVGDEPLEDQETNKYMIEAERFKLLDNQCNKCRENVPNVVLRGKDAYCKECFMAATVHKFKALLGKHRLIRPNDKVLVYCKEGHPSMALLHFLRSGLDLTAAKKLRFDVVFLYIDDKFDYSLEIRQELLKSVKNQVESYKFQIYFVSLIDYIVNKCNISDILHDNHDDIKIHDNDLERLQTVINKKANESNRNEILHLYKRNLLVQVAKSLNCKAIFTPELAIDTASQLLTNVSLGRGIHLPLDIGVCDTRDPDVTIIRPLRLFNIKQLAFYNYFSGLQPVVLPEKKFNVYSSIQNLMKSFVANLQDNFPATITTIVRTGDKLGADKHTKNEICELCKAPKENQNQQLSSAESTIFSHFVSTETPNYKPDEYVNSFHSRNSKYCYACRKLSNDLK